VTWYANRIYVNDSLDVRAKLREEPALAGHVFRLSGTLPGAWEPGAAELQLPAEGLVCIKEVAPWRVATEEENALAAMFGESPAPPAPRPAHAWFGEDEFLPWTALEGPRHRCGSRRVLEETDAEALQRPPLGLLRFLGELHDACQVPVTYYLCRTFGGHVDEEAAWIFGATDLVCRHLGPTKTRVTDPSRERIVADGVLALALAHHGIRLPESGYFAPHTRGFDWARQRIAL
jgi:hypothetical protein